MPESERLGPLLAFLERLPAIDLPAGRKSIAAKITDDGRWWVKFSLDTNHRLACRVVQELGHVLNYLSIEERLPTAFMPVSPPPYLNGGVEFLSWVIENRDGSFKRSSSVLQQASQGWLLLQSGIPGSLCVAPRRAAQRSRLRRRSVRAIRRALASFAVSRRSVPCGPPQSRTVGCDRHG